ncbi:MAG: Uncharacterised protein [Gammaproteobacteria bacterium]|nr:MAG: Uncharacterised protein [Gammaproteobacteria bacterium]|tara:strand:- start:457 stop:846 length:390 start_codon:yes stop_codon:yes gene_type:complete
MDLTLFLISIWVGSIIFFSAIIAPTVFKALDEKNAGIFLRAFFPKYYIFGIILGFIALILGIKAMSLILVSMVVAMILLSIISRLMIPVINAARDMGVEGESRFKKLHTLSVFLNILTLIIGLIFIYMG